jgi:hypothetical protein
MAAGTGRDTAEVVFEMLTGDDAGRVCADIPDSACREQPQSFLTHVAALGLTKTADGLIDPKLVLSWLLAHLGASAGLIGLLVPVREAGALLPQLVTAGWLRSLPRRKWAWAGASLVQGLSALGIALVALSMQGAAAGWAILGLLAALAVARSVASVTYKDVLGKTVDKARRGSTTGTATSLSAVGVIAFALLLMAGVIERPTLVVAGLVTAAGFWIVAAALFATLAEEAGATEGGGNALDFARDAFGTLRREAQLRRFIVTRGLLIATALAPPYMIALDPETSGTALGGLVLASALASLLSAYVWGRLADRSSRRVLALAAATACGTLVLTVVAASLGAIAQPVVLAGLIFAIMIAHQGVRLGRSTHLVDMAGKTDRALYTALSNTAIGLLLLAGGAFALLAEAFGPGSVLVVFAVMTGLAVLAALRLDEVQQG